MDVEKRRKEKMQKNNNMKSNFSTTANIFVRNFFPLIGFNLWTNFIEIIRLNKLLMLFKDTSIYHSEGERGAPPLGAFGPKTPARELRPLDPLFYFRACSAGYLTQKDSEEYKR